MTRIIKASEVKPGMEIEWSKDGVLHRMQCQRNVEFKNEFLKKIAGYTFYAEGGGVQYISADQTVTVLVEPQPEEPTAFGACVEVAGVKYVRVDEHEPAWMDSVNCDCNYWADIINAGPVTVLNADPSISTGQREPRVWDRWADVPEMTPIRVGYGIETQYRKVGDRIEFGRAGSWVPAFADEHALNEYAPFTEKI